MELTVMFDKPNKTRVAEVAIALWCGCVAYYPLIKYLCRDTDL